MSEKQSPYEMACAFHEVFNPQQPEQPTAFSPELASRRAEFKVEELVEFLYSAANNDQVLFQQLVNGLKKSVDKAEQKVLAKGKSVSDPLVEEVDALVDLLYFTYGSFCLMGVNPTKIIEIVHQANMGKLFPDGQPHYDPETNKVLKPENWEQDFAPEAKIKAEIQRQLKITETNKKDE